MTTGDYNLKRELRETESSRLDVHQTIERRGYGWLSRLIGQEQLEEMFKSCDKTESCLQSSDTGQRMAALFLLTLHWKTSKLCSPETMKHSAFHDPDPQVRAAALSGFAHFYFESNNQDIGRFLANILMDQSQDELFRGAAYCGLLDLKGIEAISKISPAGIRFPDDIDWKLVSSFLGTATEENALGPDYQIDS